MESNLCTKSKLASNLFYVAKAFPSLYVVHIRHIGLGGGPEFVMKDVLLQSAGLIFGVGTLGWPTYVAGILAAQKNRRIPVRILNPTESPVTIRRGEQIALYSAVQSIEDERWSNCRPVHLDDEKQDLKHDCEELTQIWGDLEDVDEECKEKFRNLVKEYGDRFHQSGKKLGRTGLVRHKINTGDHPAIKQRPRREPMALQGAVKTEIDKMLQYIC